MRAQRCWPQNNLACWAAKMRISPVRWRARAWHASYAACEQAVFLEPCNLRYCGSTAIRTIRKVERAWTVGSIGGTGTPTPCRAKAALSARPRCLKHDGAEPRPDYGAPTSWFRHRSNGVLACGRGGYPASPRPVCDVQGPARPSPPGCLQPGGLLLRPAKARKTACYAGPDPANNGHDRRFAMGGMQ